MLKSLLNRSQAPQTQPKKHRNKLLSFREENNNPVLNEIMLQLRDRKKLAELGRSYNSNSSKQSGTELSSDFSDAVDVETLKKLRKVSLKENSSSNSNSEFKRKTERKGYDEIDFDVFQLL
ncbi:Hypothetical_protein [Hexamita inflata]|uniref:Hypothetical_protein n=1 Tax=Hexamita inflata TaxID=28002 RepID=A0AA86PWW9_9EUKA|nr:Hypothetical protein HINF_LOCUS35404 [Hexamita inflata]